MYVCRLKKRESKVHHLMRRLEVRGQSLLADFLEALLRVERVIYQYIIGLSTANVDRERERERERVRERERERVRERERERVCVSLCACVCVCLCGRWPALVRSR